MKFLNKNYVPLILAAFSFGLIIAALIDPGNPFINHLWLILAISAGAGLIVFGALQTMKLEVAWAERVGQVENRVGPHPTQPSAAWELAQSKLETYLDRNLQQVRSIYWLTLGAMIVGFSLIIAGIIRAYADPAEPFGPILSTSSGVLINFVAATFLVIYRATMNQARGYVSVLERINAVGMAVQILSTLESGDGELHRQTTAEVAKQLLTMYGHEMHSDKVPR